MAEEKVSVRVVIPCHCLDGESGDHRLVICAVVQLGTR